MKVKQLEWNDGEDSSFAYGSAGSYFIAINNLKSYEVDYSVGGFQRWSDTCPSMEDAKDVCQQHYEEKVMMHLEDCHPSPQELFESMAPIVRYGYNKACVELCEWINVDESTFTFDELMNKLNDMIDNKREMTSDDFLEYLKSEEE